MYRHMGAQYLYRLLSYDKIPTGELKVSDEIHTDTSNRYLNGRDGIQRDKQYRILLVHVFQNIIPMTRHTSLCLLEV